jgi:hypothetical protein
MVLVLAMFFCSPVGATEIAVVGAHVQALTVEEAEELVERLSEGIRQKTSLEPIGPVTLRQRLVGRQELVLEQMANASGLKKLEEGKLLYDRAQPTQALGPLDTARQLLSRSVAVTGDTRHLRDAFLFLGLSHTALGDDPAAKRAFAQAVVLDPSLELDPLRYPPRIQKAFADIRNRIRSAAPATLKIQVPEGMSVSIWVDGRKRGTAPLTVAALPPGRHFVRAVGPNGHRGYKSVGLSPDQDMQLFLPMDQHGLGQVGSTRAERSRQTQNLYRALGKHVQTELILVLGLEDSNEISLQLYSPRNDRFSKPLTLDSSGDWVENLVGLVPMVLRDANSQGDILADKVAVQSPALRLSANAVLTRILLEDGRRVEPPKRPKNPQNTNWGIQRYKWWLVGGGAVVLGGAGAALAIGAGPKDQGTITVGPIP